MELEIRNKDGYHMVTFKNDLATSIYYKINSLPEFIRNVRKLGKKDEHKKDYVVYVCSNRCGYEFYNSVEIVLNEGDYIKVINK